MPPIGSRPKHVKSLTIFNAHTTKPYRFLEERRPNNKKKNDDNNINRMSSNLRSVPGSQVNRLREAVASTHFRHVEARQRLRSSSSSSLIVNHTRLSTVGDRAFPVAAARVWNSLPELVTSAPFVAVFRSRLKTHLFNIPYPSPL